MVQWVAQHVGWRGKRKSEPEPILHGWQQKSPQAAERSLLPGDHRRDLKVAGLLFIAAGLLAALLYLLLFRPEQTPLISVAVTEYSWPIPPNAWAAEDLQALTALHGETLHQVDLSAAWQSKERGLRNLEQQLRLAVERRSSLGVVLVYLSMHGVIDGRDEPCLLAADASPLQSESWLPVRTLLARIKSQQLPENVTLVLILDSNRFDTHWPLGQLYNGFAERLPAVVDAARISNLVVINSTAPNQVGWTSGELRGSVFGHFVREGLRGAADVAGNHNRVVSLHELHRYLQHEVGQWVATRRLDAQQPMLLPANTPDRDLAWSMRGGLSGRLPSAASPASADAVSDDQLAELWRKHDQVLSLQPVRFNPLAWRDFEQKLLWLEQLSVAGSAYAGLAKSTAGELEQLANAVLKQTRSDTGKAVLPLANALSISRTIVPESLAAHSLPVMEYLGQGSPAAIAQLRGVLQQASTNISPEAINRLQDSLDSVKGQGSPQLTEVQFLKILGQHLPPAAWARSDLVSRAVQLRLQAEATAMPADERTQHWIRDAITAGDRARREVEDLLMVGSPDALDQANGRIAMAEGYYKVSQATAEQIARALAIRDQGWAEITAIAGWYARQLPAGHDPQQLDRQINDELLPLVESLHVLGWWLSHDPSRARLEIDADQVSEQAAKVQKGLEALRQRIIDPRRCRELAETTQPSPDVLREIEAALATPLMPAPLRADLWRAKTSLTAIIDRAESMPVSTEHNTNNSPSAPTLAQRISLNWKRHPALAILSRWKIDPDTAPGSWPMQSSQSAPQAIEAIAAQGQEVRQLLAGLPQQIDSLIEEPHDFDDSDAASVPAGPATGAVDQETWRSAQVRAGSCRAERLARAAAGFGFPPTSSDVAARLRTVDLHQAMLWQAVRTIDDYYAATVEGQPDYFVSAAESYLKSAQSLDPPMWAARQEQVRVQSLLTRRQAASRALQPFAADMVLIDEPADAMAEISLPTTDAAAGLPVGQAAVFVSAGDGQAGAAEAVSVPPASDGPSAVPATVKCPLPSRGSEDNPQQLEAVALFRGHRFAHPFLARPPAGSRSVFQRTVYETARVTLQGNRRNTGSIVFILDCSSSMREPTTVEGPAGARQVERLQVAKDALLGMLDRLAEDGGYRVGVRFFGHRVKRNLNNPREILHETGYGRPIPPGLLPSEDVELVLPVGRFGAATRDEIVHLLDTVRPCGETPLYLSILEAQRDLAGEAATGSRSIVVITDGANNQYNSPNPRSAAEVLTAAERGTQVHIVGFQLSEEDEARAQREFTQIAEQTGGRYFPASNATALTRYLESLLGDATWRIADLQGRQIGERNIGFAISAPTADGQPRRYLVEAGEAERLVRSEIELTGGEALDLHLTADGRRIALRRFDRDSPVFHPLTPGDAGSPTALLLGAHRPSWQGPHVAFDLSIQSDAGRFVSKPIAIWTEITPIIGGSPGSSYVFLDPAWVPDRPVAVLGCVADDWPAGARQAEVRFWSRYQPWAADVSTTIGEAVERRRRGQSAVAEELFPGVSIQVNVKPGASATEPLRIAVLERHAGDPAGQGSLRIDLTPAADRIERLNDPVNHLLLHTFYYFSADQDEAAGFELQVTTRKSWIADAVLLGEPIVVAVPEPSDVIRLTPPPTGPMLPAR